MDRPINGSARILSTMESSASDPAPSAPDSVTAANIRDLKINYQHLTVAWGKMRVLKEMLVVTHKRFAQKKKENAKLKTFLRELRSTFKESSECLRDMQSKYDAREHYVKASEEKLK